MSDERRGWGMITCASPTARIEICDNTSASVHMKYGQRGWPLAELTEISIARMSRPVRPPTSGGAVGSRCSAERPWCVGGRWSVVVRECGFHR